jgi:hypothetical protein
MSNLILKQYRTEPTAYTKAKKIAQKKGLTMSQLHRLLDEIASDEERLTVFLDLKPKQEFVMPASYLPESEIDRQREELLEKLHTENPKPARTLTNQQMDEIIYDL